VGRGEFLEAAGVGAGPLPGPQKLCGNSSPLRALLGCPKHGEKQPVSPNVGPSARLVRWVATGDIEHGTHKVNACPPGVLRLDEAGVDIDEHESLVRYDDIGRQRAVPAKILSEHLEPGARSRKFDAALVAGPTVGSLANTHVGVERDKGPMSNTAGTWLAVR